VEINKLRRIVLGIFFLLHDSHSVDKEPLVGQVVGGLHYERRHWGIHFNGLITADTVNSKKSSAAENGERLGTIVIEWRF